MISALKMIKFNVAAINLCTEAEGPYKRLTIWFQGCNLHCEGCCNPDFQPLIPKHFLCLDQLLEIISDAKERFGIDGVTYSGGEPTLQQNLPLLTEKIKELGLGVISFTGRRYGEVEDILCGCDVVLDGSYQKDKPEKKRRLLGSENQRILCITDRYRDCIDEWFVYPNSINEINIGKTLVINGDKI